MFVMIFLYLKLILFIPRQFKEQQRLNRQGETSSTAYRLDQKISDPGPGPTRSGYQAGHSTRSESVHTTKTVQKHSLDIKSLPFLIPKMIFLPL